MYRLFRGQARILGVRDKKLNCKGFEGPMNSVERGTDGFIPDVASGRELTITSLEYELRSLLEPYDLTVGELPKEVQLAIKAREAFTLVEGIDPVGLCKGRIDAKDLVHKTIRHDQSTLAIQQVCFNAIHNGRMINDGKPLELDPVEPYPGFEHPIVYDIPEELFDEKGDIQSTTLGGTRPRGRLILYTSRENMHAAYKELRSRWKVTYRTQYQMIGSKLVSELIPQTPGSYFVYATGELSALEPDYVEPGRRRPLPGPLIEAVDLFIAEKMRSLAKEINERRRHEIDRQALDEVHEENRLPDNF